MVGVPVGSNPTSLTEIAEACHDYSKPNNLNSFRYVYTTDGGRAGGTYGTGELKYSQFIGKNVAYNVTGTSSTAFAEGPEDQSFPSWSSFAASRGLEFIILAAPNNGSCESMAYKVSDLLNGTETWRPPPNTGSNRAGTDVWQNHYIDDMCHAMAISRRGHRVLSGETTISGSTYNAIWFYTDPGNPLDYSGAWYWSTGYDWQTGFGTKFGHLIHSGVKMYVPTRAGLYGGSQMVTILKVHLGTGSTTLSSTDPDYIPASNHSIDDWYWGGVWHYGHSIQLSENLDRFVIDNGPGASVDVYTTDGTNDSQEQTLTTTGGTGHVYCNSDCSVIVSGSSIWHRSGTTWTAANTDEIVNRNIDPRTCDISDDGTIVVYKRDGASNDPGGADQLNHFHYHKTNNRWYYTGTSNLGTTGENNRFLGGGFSSTNIGVRNDGLVIGKWDAGMYASPNAKPKAYKGTIGVHK